MSGERPKAERPQADRRTGLPIRLRLSLLYTALFLAGGAVLVGVTYGLVRASLSRVPTPSRQVVDTCKALTAPAGPAKAGSGLPGKEATQSPPRATPTPTPQTSTNCKQVFENLGASGQRRRTLHDLLLYSLLALGGTAALSAGGGWIVAGRVLSPLREITGAARRASGTTLHERIALVGPRDELTELADTFDAMLDRLDAAFASQRRFVANASHELRTPLTIMRTSIDVTLAQRERTPEQLEAMARDVRGAIERSEALIEALLMLARGDRAGVLATEAVDLATAAEDALDGAAAGIRGAGLEVQAVLDPAPTTGDPVLLERLAANLVGNATRYNVASGWLRVTTGQRNGSAFLEVANAGPLVPEELVERLFEPFQRLAAPDGDRATPGRDGPQGPQGLGLGLAIVRSVATAHGGSVTARARPAGGLEVTVSIPGAPGPPGA